MLAVYWLLDISSPSFDFFLGNYLPHLEQYQGVLPSPGLSDHVTELGQST